MGWDGWDGVWREKRKSLGGRKSRQWGMCVWGLRCFSFPKVTSIPGRAAREGKRQRQRQQQEKCDFHRHNTARSAPSCERGESEERSGGKKETTKSKKGAKTQPTLPWAGICRQLPELSAAWSWEKQERAEEAEPSQLPRPLPLPRPRSPGPSPAPARPGSGSEAGQGFFGGPGCGCHTIDFYFLSIRVVLEEAEQGEKNDVTEFSLVNFIVTFLPPLPGLDNRTKW